MAALAGAAMLLLPVLDPLSGAAPWALPLIAAGTGAAAGLALFRAWDAHRRPARPESQRLAPTTPPTVSPSAEHGGGGAGSAADAARIAALEEALHEMRRRMSAQLRAQQMAAMDARAELACTIVHDLNNALGAVAGYADFLAADLPADSPQADYVGRILLALDRARPGFRRLVTAARMEPVAVVQERAARVLDEAAALLRTASATPASLAVRHDPATPDPLCDAGLLARTLAGLAAEIVLATGAGTDLRFCLRAGSSGVSGAVSCGGSHREAAGGDLDSGEGEDAAGAGWHVRQLLQPREGPHTLFELRVNGAPLADDLLFALVDPLLSVRTRYRRGQPVQEDADWPTALSTARRHDGGLSLLTHPVEGTAVRLYIPAVSTPRPVPMPAAPALPSQQRKAPVLQVLVVEADPASGDRFQTGLERQGFEVSVCDDLRDALDVVADEPGFFDAVVIGPGLSALPAGMALAGRLKELRGDLPCVLYGTDSRCGPAGPADLVLPTPVDLPRLARGVAALAAGGPDGTRAGGERG
jgi:CheY-like chemotaxis protein